MPTTQTPKPRTPSLSPHRASATGGPLTDTAAETSPSAFAGGLVGGRLTVDSPLLLNIATPVIIPPTDYAALWSLINLDTKYLMTLPPHILVEVLTDLSPDLARAVWDFGRMCNPGWSIDVYLPGTKTIHPQAQAAISLFLDRLTLLYGSPNIPIGRLFSGAFMRGAMLAELVLDPAGRIPVDLATPDPHSIRFQRHLDPVRGSIWILGQWQASRGFVLLDRPTIRYAPIDPFPASPYGRPLVNPAIFPVIFLLSTLQDLKRVIQQQGYPRIDIDIILQKLRDSLPPDAQSNPKKFLEWTQALYDEIQSRYAALAPDDAYVHTDVIKINRSVGTVDAHSLGAIDPVISMLERMATRALKTVPLLMGVADASGEANSNRQWECFTASIKSIQSLAAHMLEILLQLALQAQGLQADITWNFNTLRASEEFRDAQTTRLKTLNAQMQYAAGWISQDEAALAVVGHTSDQPDPRIPLVTPGSSTSGSNPDAVGTANPGDGSTRSNGHVLTSDPLTAVADRDIAS